MLLNTNMEAITNNTANDSNNMDNNVKIFRFTFSKDLSALLHAFGKEHNELDRKSYLQTWNRWLHENETLIEDEHTNLKKKGFSGNFEEKMFKSARYYFRKKSDDVKPTKQRRKYISVDRDILDIIDTHIKSNHQTIQSPAKCYEHFIENNKEALEEEYKRLHDDENLSNDDCINKIKKTYKNRYFQIHNLNIS